MSCSGGQPSVLLVDPSPRGGIPAYTFLVGKALRSAGACPEILGSELLDHTVQDVPLARRLPVDRWGKPAAAGPGFYVQRTSTWLRSARIVNGHVRRWKPDVVHFQAPINRRLDPMLL
ncbi:MAG: hypothetical protein C5B48_04745, partial [Candidatus Rokuibacteriota bacterium]